jgi:dolichyl-phosphate beta-glucosyltransferase
MPPIVPPTRPTPTNGSVGLSIVLPAFDEAARIGPALDELFAYLDSEAARAGLPTPIEVVVVDDGSRDATARVVAARPEASRTPAEAALTAPASVAAPAADPCAYMRLLRVPHGGKGSAVRAGMLRAAGDLIVFADADMATPPDQLTKLVDALQSADVALGSRIQPDGSDMRATQPPYRRLLGRIFHALASAWVVGPVQDTQCGFKGFSRTAARDLFGQQRVTSIVFDVEIIHLALRRGYRIAIVPIRWEDRMGSRMRPRVALAIQVAWDLFRIPFLHRRLRRPGS